MAGTTTEMSKIRQIIQHLKHGKVSNRKMADILGINKETVNNYVRKIKADSKSLEELLEMEDPELEHRFKGGSPAYVEDAKFKEFQQWLPKIIEEMGEAKKTHVTLKLLYEEYRQAAAFPYSLTQFRYHYNQHVKASSGLTTTLLKDLYEPGLLVYLDFAGDKMSYVELESGEVVKVEVFVATFPFSDYGFALAVPSQNADDFAFALISLFRHIGGVPRILVPDNLKAAVDKADRFAPKLNTLLQDLASYYGAVVEPARVRHPKDKSAVENSVKLVYQRVYAPLRNRVFHSLRELNEAIAEQMLAHNRKRMQQYDHTREECFLSNEKPNLLPLPVEDYEVKRIHELRVQDSCFIYLSSHKTYYSAPKEWIGSKVKAVVTRTKVKIYAQGTCVAIHLRDPRRKWIYDPSHFPENSQQWRGRNKDWFIARAQAIHPSLGTYVECIFKNCNTVEQCMYKTCDAVLHLGRETPPDVLVRAIEESHIIGRYSHKLLERLVAKFKAGICDSTDACVLSPPVNHEGIRGPQAFV